jgi:uncharacterized protein YfaQ (DUF2300 family)
MVNIQIENSPLSIQLSDTESVTVPTGEVWKVTVTGRSASTAKDESDYAYIERYCKINGTIVASSESKSDGWEDGDVRANVTANASSTFPFDTVLVGGDVIKSEGGELNVSGFVVN